MSCMLNALKLLKKPQVAYVFFLYNSSKKNQPNTRGVACITLSRCTILKPLACVLSLQGSGVLTKGVGCKGGGRGEGNSPCKAGVGRGRRRREGGSS